MNLAIKTLSDMPERLSEIISLIEKEFLYPKEHKYLVDFYPQFAFDNLKNCYFLINSNNTIVAHIGVLKKKFTILKNQKKHSIHINFIGSVVTSKKFQKKGYLNFLFKHVLSKLKDTGALNILWSDKTDLFNKYNFFECGSLYQTGHLKCCPENLPAPYRAKSLSLLSSKEELEILELYNNYSHKYFSPERTLKDLKILKNISSANILLFKNEKINKTNGYIIFDKGNDLSGIIYEIIYQQDLSNKINSIIKDITCWSPSVESSNNYNNRHIIYSCFAMINNPSEYNYMYQLLTNRKNKNCLLSPKQQLVNLFGPGKPETNFPLWISGLDSI